MRKRASCTEESPTPHGPIGVLEQRATGLSPSNGAEVQRGALRYARGMRSKLTFAFSLGILVACSANQAVQVSHVDAQPRAPGAFRECIARLVNDDPTPIPAGWTPVGGAGPRYAVILCR